MRNLKYSVNSFIKSKKIKGKMRKSKKGGWFGTKQNSNNRPISENIKKFYDNKNIISQILNTIKEIKNNIPEAAIKKLGIEEFQYAENTLADVNSKYDEFKKKINQDKNEILSYLKNETNPNFDKEKKAPTETPNSEEVQGTESESNENGSSEKNVDLDINKLLSYLEKKHNLSLIEYLDNNKIKYRKDLLIVLDSNEYLCRNHLSNTSKSINCNEYPKKYNDFIVNLDNEHNATFIEYLKKKSEESDVTDNEKIVLYKADNLYQKYRKEISDLVETSTNQLESIERYKKKIDDLFTQKEQNPTRLQRFGNGVSTRLGTAKNIARSGIGRFGNALSKGRNMSRNGITKARSTISRFGSRIGSMFSRRTPEKTVTPQPYIEYFGGGHTKKQYGGRRRR